MCISVITFSNVLKAEDQSGTENTVEQYLDEIHRLEVRYGPRHEAIGENLINLAKLYDAQGDKLKRRETLKQALQIHRLNYGLDSKDQLPIIEQLIADNLVLEDWQALDRNYDYLYWINRRIYGVDSLELLPVLNRVLEWKQNVVKQDLFGNPDIMNIQVVELLRKIQQIRNKHLGESAALFKRTVFY
jgi:hypothetical protein